MSDLKETEALPERQPSDLSNYAAAAKTLAAAKVWMCRPKNYPYFTGTVFSLRTVWTDNSNPFVDTMAVDSGFRLYVNTDYLAGISDEDARLSLLHEVHHVLRQHSHRQGTRSATAINKQTGAIAKVWNIAADCEINGTLLENWPNTSTSKVADMLVTPERLDLPEDELAETYYRLLIERNQDDSTDDVEGDNGEYRDGEHTASDNGDISDEKAKEDVSVDSGAHHASTDPSENSDSLQKGKDNNLNVGSAASDRKSRTCDTSGDFGEQSTERTDADTLQSDVGMPDCVLPDEQKANADAAADTQDQPSMTVPEVEALIQAAAKSVLEAKSIGVGRESSMLIEWAKELLTPKIDWRAELRRLYRLAVKSVPGVEHQTFRKLNRRRVPSYNNVIMPGRHLLAPEVGLLVDTSGSMSAADLSASVSEISGLLAALSGDYSMSIWSCDSDVYDPVTVRNVSSLTLKGGGGTDMGLGLSRIAESSNCNVVVCITDGYTPWPSEEEFKKLGLVLIVVVVSKEKVLPSYLSPPKSARVLFVPPMDLAA